MTKAYKPKEQESFVAPDGDWGWMIVLGCGLSSMVIISTLQSFGLMNKDRLLQLQFSATDITSLMSVNSSFGMILGIFNGPLLKKFGYRKIALLGAVLFVSGTFYTAFAENYIQFLISYGMISSLGSVLSLSSHSLALNTFFKLKRSMASSFSMTLMGIGPIVMPLLITQLLSSYGWKWTVLIVSAITMHTFVGALLLQPVKWHLRRLTSDETSRQNGDTVLEKLQAADRSSMVDFGASFLDLSSNLCSSRLSLGKRSQRGSQYSIVQEISGTRNRSDMTRKLRSVTSLDNDDYGDMMKSTLYVLESSTPKEKPLKYASVETLDHSSNKRNSYEAEKLLSNSLDVRYMPADACANKADDKCDDLPNESPQKKKKAFLRETLEFIKIMYDFDLLLDPIYINLLIGLSIATVGEIIFSLLTPFILTELGLSLRETSFFMSITGITDVIFRFLCPFFGRCCNFSSRIMYISAISILLITRASLLLANNITGFIISALFLGVGKGFRTVYWNLVVPDYVPLSKLPSANAFQNLFNGISLLISGPVVGAIVANSGNKYSNVVFVSNFLTFITIVMWSIEFIIVYRRNKKSKMLPT
ncbi:UNVERIFIED_CONTAM: hypothetical protein PYX00_003545 [Menopon gallinae]|uniref:Major facilitator superfamily (MFS) profile domain-containing protein n=1 Tax=Menopon gallinae TaxID=328185 RepID=A0AAW2I0R1_9NEOP